MSYCPSKDLFGEGVSLMNGGETNLGPLPREIALDIGGRYFISALSDMFVCPDKSHFKGHFQQTRELLEESILELEKLASSGEPNASHYLESQRDRLNSLRAKCASCN